MKNKSFYMQILYEHKKSVLFVTHKMLNVNMFLDTKEIIQTAAILCSK